MKSGFWQSQTGGLVTLAAVMALLPMLITSDLYFNVANNVGIRALLCLGLSLLLGFAGQISLGHAGFFAIGAYSSALLTSRLDWPVPVALLAGAAVCALIALIIGRSILRLRGHLLAMATLAMGSMIYIILNQNVALFGGPDGISVKPFEVGGFRLQGGLQWYIAICCAVLAGTWLALNLVNSPVGRALVAIKGSEVAAEVSGVDIARYKLLIFVVSAVYASVAGSLFAHYTEFITPGEAELLYSFEMLIIVLLGGMGSIYGAIVGAAILMSLPHLLTWFHDYETLVFGLVLVFTVLFLPRGLLPTLQQRWRKRGA
ncbi:branched-chain amino acid ABC transporter permease [Ottowia thiooxydans]|uniref:branched-chain amino acid ABC transporter permease n=1 Tax=Ottowia thiooxydans TaxID=219182 RepID=UPI0003F6B04B|nr:branched-chain amino acid ABC transporter permease [Ottowia thiooxydans]